MNITIRADLDNERLTFQTRAWNRTLTAEQADAWAEELAEKAENAADDARIILKDDGDTLAIRTPQQAANIAETTLEITRRVIGGTDA